jgi:parvulin-like peptidyl-prolyl isomerase
MLAVALIALIAGLAACSSDDSDGNNEGFVHIEEQTPVTDVAQADPTATSGPSPTPPPTALPFFIPTNAPDVDSEMVITRIGTAEITLADFQKQVRFERWYRLYQLAKLVEKYGVEQVLDLRKSENAQVSSLFATLADTQGFGAQVQRIMIIDAIALQEAIRRGVEVDPYQFDARVAQYLVMQVGEGGQLPPEFDAEYEKFIAQMTTYSGMTEEEFRRVVRARTLYAQLKFLISNEPEALEAAQTAPGGVEVQDILTPTVEEAEAIITRLQAGESVREIAVSLGMTPQSEDEWRTVRISDENTPQDVLDALFNAQPGEIIGPIATERGWYVALVGAPVVDALTPKEIDALKEQYFLKWVESKMDDPDYVEDFANWSAYIPQEPLPQDVSPLLRDENVILPEDTE